MDSDQEESNKSSQKPGHDEETKGANTTQSYSIIDADGKP